MVRVVHFLRTCFFRMSIVALGVSTLCFLAVDFAPGDRAVEVAIARYGLDGASPSAVEYVRTSEGLNRSPLVRYREWLYNLLQGNWGYSIVGKGKIFPLLIRNLQRTVLLSLVAICLSLLIALPVGIYCGCRPGSLIDLCSSALSSVVVSFPSFLIGVMIILLLAVKFHIFPVAGFSSPSHVLLPSLTLAIGLASASSRVIAAALLQVRQSEHYLFAKHKGLSGLVLFLYHGLLNASPPIIIYIGLQIAGLLDGVVVIETLFAWPGIGSLLLEAVQSGDILVVQGAGVFLGWIYVTVNTLAEWSADRLAPFGEGSSGTQ